MRRYETIIIIDPDLSEEQRAPLFERCNNLIPQYGGLLIMHDNWDQKKLAYDIKKKARGYYTRFDYCGTGDLVSELERFFRIDDRVLKFMTVLLEKQVDIERIKEEMLLAETAEKEAAAAENDALEKNSTSDAETAIPESREIQPEGSQSTVIQSQEEE